MNVETIRRRLRALGARPAHEEQVLRAWTQALPLGSGKRRAEHYFPARLRQAFPELARELADIARLRSRQAGADGSARLLIELADGQTAESVLLPRGAVCVSTQVGCAVGCTFCMTGREGLKRHLGSAEIVAQVALARGERAVRKVQFMGMGEPAHNLENVLEATELLGTLGGIGHKNLVVSTVGEARLFERLPRARVKPALALSLHTTDPDLRARLLPHAPRITPDELIERSESYARATGYPIQIQWTLIDGVNDSEREIARLASLLAGKYAVVNFIPWNAVPGLPYRRPAWERAVDLTRALLARGILAKLRDSAAQDVDGACGQLRTRALQPA